MANGLWITILSPYKVKKRYSSGKLKGTRMSKLAMEALDHGYTIACVYCKGLNGSIESHNPYGLNDATYALARFLQYPGLHNMYVVDFSHSDAIYIAYKIDR